MMPIPELTIDLGTQVIGFGWTMDGTAIALLVVLLIPWLVLGLAAIIDVLGIAPRHVAIASRAVAATETIVAEPPVLTGAVLRQAA